MLTARNLGRYAVSKVKKVHVAANLHMANFLGVALKFHQLDGFVGEGKGAFRIRQMWAGCFDAWTLQVFMNHYDVGYTDYINGVPGLDCFDKCAVCPRCFAWLPQ